MRERMSRRRTATPLLLLLLTLAAFALTASGCGDEPEHPVAFVGDTAIAREQLDAAIEQLLADRRRKGEVEEFPVEGTPGYRRLRDSVLSLLVFRAELQQTAQRLGIRVGDDEVERAIVAGGGAPGEGEGGSLGREARELARDSIRTQLLYQRVYAKVTRGVMARRRREAMSRFITRMRKTARVRYEPGYAPGS
jgi:hypothetical protein